MNKHGIPRITAVRERVNGGRVLNVGCVGQYLTNEKDGWLHRELVDVSDELIGVDIDSEGVAGLKHRGWNVRIDNAETLSTITESIDVVVAGELIEHLSNPGRFLQASKTVLKDNGKLLLTTPNPWAIVYLRRVLRGTDPVGNEEHTCWFDATTIRELINRYGYEGEITHLPPETPGLSSMMYRSSKKLGGTRILADLRLCD